MAPQAVEGVIYAKQGEEEMSYRYYLADDHFCDLRVFNGPPPGRFYSKERKAWDSFTGVREDNAALWQVPDTWLILARIPLHEHD